MKHRNSAFKDRLHAVAIAAALLSTSVSIVLADTPEDGKTTAYEASDQPIGDSWITTKVKADLLANEQTKGLDINVSTTNGVVTLSGRLDSKADVKKAVKIARSIKGVTAVDAKTLTVKPRS
jgi:hyperosmotically inducible periplasmic protein